MKSNRTENNVIHMVQCEEIERRIKFYLLESFVIELFLCVFVSCKCKTEILASGMKFGIRKL